MKNFYLINGDEEFLFTNLSNLEGWEHPTIRTVIEDLPSRDGSLYIGAKYGRRRISWQGLISCPGGYADRRKIIEVMRVGTLKTLKFTTFDNWWLQMDVEILNLIMPYKMKNSIALIEAVAPDYRMYSQNMYSQSTAVTTNLGGLPIPAAIPAPIGGVSNLNFAVLNEGNVETSPVFTIRGPGTNFVVTNVETGQQFRLNMTLQSSESVVIDVWNRTVKLGNQNVFGNFSGDWMDLIPGNNRLLFNAGAGTNVNTRLTVAWRSAFLGI